MCACVSLLLCRRARVHSAAQSAYPDSLDARVRSLAELTTAAAEATEPARALAPRVQLATFIDHATGGVPDDDGSGAAGGGGLVVLSTIHAAKGLEWDDVFIVGVEENVLPHARAIAGGEVSEVWRHSRRRRWVCRVTPPAPTGVPTDVCGHDARAQTPHADGRDDALRRQRGA